MNEELIKQVMSMMGSDGNNKKLSESIDKAMKILKSNNLDDLKNAIVNQDFSNIKNAPKDMAFDISKIIDTLPEEKKKALSDKYNSPEFQKMLAKDKDKAIQMLINSIIK